MSRETLSPSNKVSDPETVRVDDANAALGGKPSSGNKGFDRQREKYEQEVESFDMRQQLGSEGPGINLERKCTDVVWLVAFLVACTTMMAMVGYSLGTGRPARLIAPYDRAGNMCGFQRWNDATNAVDSGAEDMEGFPYLYITKPALKGAEKYKWGVCVRKCPKAGEVFTEEDCRDAGDKIACREVVAEESFPVESYCVSAKYDKLNHSSWYKDLGNAISASGAGGVFADLSKAWTSMTLCVFTALMLSVAFTWLMSQAARCLALASIAIVLISFAVFGATLLALGVQNESSGQIAAGSILLAFLLCECLCVWCWWDSLQIAIALVDAAADFFMATKRIVLVSVLYFGVQMAVILLWIGAQIAIYALNHIDHPSDGGQEKKVTWKSSVQGMSVFLFFGLLWTLKFIDDKTKFIAMASAATYYFDSNRQQEGQAKVGLAFHFAYANHLGSIALGSFCVTIITFLKFCAEALETAGNGDGGAQKALAAVAKCILCCLEKIADYFGKVGYAYMAVTGDSFCTSAWSGFLLNLKHCSKFVFALKLQALFVGVGILAVTCLNTGLTWLFFKYAFAEADDYNLVACISAFATISLITVVIFLGLFDEVVLAMCMCWAIDIDLHGDVTKYGPPTFNEKIDALNGDSYGKYTENQSQTTAIN